MNNSTDCAQECHSLTLYGIRNATVYDTQRSTSMGHGHSVNLSYWEVILMRCLATWRNNRSTRWPGSVGSDGSYRSVGHHCVYSHSGCCCTVHCHLVQEINKQPLLSSWAISGVCRVIVYHAGLHPRQEVNSRGKYNHIQFLVDVYVMCHKHCVSCLLCAVCTQHPL